MPADPDSPDDGSDGSADGDPPKRTSSLPILGALAVAVAAIVLIVSLGNGNSGGSPTGSEGTAVEADKALACPRTYDHRTGSVAGWVPHKPHDIVAENRLVPSRTPTQAVICSYDRIEPNDTKLVDLAGRERLGGDLAPLTRDLLAQPRLDAAKNTVCPQYLSSSDRENYLIGLSYGAATVWVSAPGYHCSGATNGVFVTARNLRATAAASYKAKRWVTQP